MKSCYTLTNLHRHLRFLCAPSSPVKTGSSRLKPPVARPLPPPSRMPSTTHPASSSSFLADWNSYAASKPSEDSADSALGFVLESAYRSANVTVSGTFSVAMVNTKPLRVVGQVNVDRVSSTESGGSNGDAAVANDSTLKPKLKPLHWVEVRANSNREMVWDQFRYSSFKLNEEMIETLFVVSTKSNPLWKYMHVIDI